MASLRSSPSFRLGSILPSQHQREFGGMASLRSSPSFRLGSILPSQHHRRSKRATTASGNLFPFHASTSSAVSSAPKARFVARRTESVYVQQLDRPLLEYMRLPASQYSVLDAQRIERVDDNTFLCYVHQLKFFNFEICPVLLVRVEEEAYGCCIRLLSCKLEGSPLVVAQNEKFSASMVNKVSCDPGSNNKSTQQLSSDTVIEVSIDIPFPFQAIPVSAIQSTGGKVLEQLLRVVLPRFMEQLARDYRSWASGDASRKPLGTGEL